MLKAQNFLTSSGPLDKLIATVALRGARKLMAEGHTPEDAATLACPGAWAVVRDSVLAAIRSNG